MRFMYQHFSRHFDICRLFIGAELEIFIWFDKERKFLEEEIAKIEKMSVEEKLADIQRRDREIMAELLHITKVHP